MSTIITVIYKIGVFVFFLLLSTSLLGQYSLRNSADSMLTVANSQQGEEKLQTLYLMASSEKFMVGGLKYIDIFEKEAQAHPDEVWLLRSCLLKSNYYVRVGAKMDSVIYYIDKARNIESDNKMLVAEVESSTLMVYMLQYKLGLLLHHAQKLLNDKKYEGNYFLKVYANLYIAIVCIETQNRKVGFEAIDNALRSLAKIADDDRMKSFLALKIYMANADLANSSNNFDLAISSCDSIKHYLHDVSLSEPEGSYRSFGNLEILIRAKTHINRGSSDDIKVLSDFENLSFPDDTPNDLNYGLFLYKSDYFYLIKNYNKSLECIDKADFYLPNHFTSVSDILQIMKQKSKILNALKRNDESYAISQQVFRMQDSVYYNSINTQIADLGTSYNAEKENIETKAKLRQTQIVSMALFAVILLSIVIALIIRKDHRTKTERNKKIYEQYLLMKSYLEEIKVQKKAYVKLHHEYKHEEDDSESLADRVDEYMNISKVFKNKNLSRNELALALGTNRQYLTDAIREKTGMTFKDYLYNIRLEYAHRMLIENENASIEEVYTESGFSSRSTFNRIFRDQFGMSPNELREITKDRISELSKPVLPK